MHIYKWFTDDEHFIQFNYHLKLEILQYLRAFLGKMSTMFGCYNNYAKQKLHRVLLREYGYSNILHNSIDFFRR